MDRLFVFVAASIVAGCTTAPREWVEPTTGMVFVEIPSGSFVMGSPRDEARREAQEAQHGVVISHPFFLGKYEVTQQQWQAVMGGNPSTFTGDGDRPVEQVNWGEVQDFMQRLNMRTSGGHFRLPTEAEWEYACRAGTTTAYSTGGSLPPEHANVSTKQTSRVGSYPANVWGLHDMHGNVWEWTQDEHCPYPDGSAVDPRGACGSSLKVIRGGSWYFDADSARCALRYTHRPADRGFSLGFRVVREQD
jgi:formylglycine-generating enzyme